MGNGVAPVRRYRPNRSWPRQLSVPSNPGPKSSPSVLSRTSNGAPTPSSARASADQSRAAASCKSVHPLPSTADAEQLAADLGGEFRRPRDLSCHGQVAADGRPVDTVARAATMAAPAEAPSCRPELTACT